MHKERIRLHSIDGFWLS